MVRPPSLKLILNWLSGGLGNDDGKLRFVGTEMLGKEFDTCGILGAELIKYMHMDGKKVICLLYTSPSPRD